MPDFLTAANGVQAVLLTVGDGSPLGAKARAALVKMHVGGQKYINSLALLVAKYPQVCPAMVDPALMLQRIQSSANAAELARVLSIGQRAADDYILETNSLAWKDALTVYANLQRYTDEYPEFDQTVADMKAFLATGPRVPKVKKPKSPATTAAGSTTGSTDSTTPTAASGNGAPSAPQTPTNTASPSAGSTSTSSTPGSTSTTDQVPVFTPNGPAGTAPSTKQ